MLTSTPWLWGRVIMHRCQVRILACDVYAMSIWSPFEVGPSRVLEVVDVIWPTACIVREASLTGIPSIFDESEAIGVGCCGGSEYLDFQPCCAVLSAPRKNC